MSTTIKINVNDITPNWIVALKKSYKNASLEIKIEETIDEQQLTENMFWSIINTFDWKKGDNIDAITAPPIAHLKKMDIATIFQFQDMLAEKLYQLDQQVFAENLGKYRYGGKHHFSVDSFLYARAAVISNGENFYESVLANPHKMPKEFTFEALLYIAADAFTQKTSKEWSYLPKISYETFSNSAGWNGKSWADSILNI